MIDRNAWTTAAIAVGAADDRLISIAEASARLGIGRTKTMELVLSGRIRSCKIAARRLVSAAALEAFIAAAFAESAAQLQNDRSDAPAQRVASIPIPDL